MLSDDAILSKTALSTMTTSDGPQTGSRTLRVLAHLCGTVGIMEGTSGTANGTAANLERRKVL